MICNKFITEISEEDFRKLNLVGYKHVFLEEPGVCKQLKWIKEDLNAVLDENIAYMLAQGYEHNLEYLQEPVTLAIHQENGPKPKDYYFDKFMNRYSEPATYEIAFGLRHIYSTRDYFEAKEDYWRVLKRETKAIYRIHLDPKHAKRFILKHKTEKFYVFKDNAPENEHYIEKSYDLDEETRFWNEKSMSEIIKTKYVTSIYPVSKEKVRNLIDLDNTDTIKC